MATAQVERDQRHTRRNPCRVCGGHTEMPQGRGERCAGFDSEDGEYCYCTREEYAGQLALNDKTMPPAFPHRMHGPCNCGVTHGAAPIRLDRQPCERITRYELRDADKRLVGVHVRTDRADGTKTFRWERHNGRGAAAMPLYGLLSHLSTPATALRIICEGEKATDALTAALKRVGSTDVVALGTVTGAPTLPCDDSLRPLVGCPVALWPDNDDVGRKQMEGIAARLVMMGAPTPKWIHWKDAPEKGDAADYFIKAGHRVDELLQLVTADTAGQPDQDDESLEPTDPVTTVEPFPLDTLPREIQAFIRTVAAAIHCPFDYVAMPLMVYASAAIGNSACLEIKRGWREYSRFWLAIVGDPGDKKSPALATVHRVIEERQRAHYAAWEAERERWRSSGSEGSEPRLTQLYTSDATIEALGDLLHDNSRGVLVTRDELSGWALAMNEYKRRGADRQHWLSLWSGAALMVNRRSRSRALYVEHPFVSVVGGIQPDVLAELCDERGRNDGFVHRLLFVYPDRKRRAWTDAEIADEAYEPLRALFDSLYERDTQDALTVTFTSTARNLWREIMNALYDEAEATDFPDALRGPWAKLEGYMARLALVVHLMRAAFDPRIDPAQCDEASLGAAADLAEYLKSHLRRVYARLLARPDDIRLLRIVAWIRDHGGTCIARDLYKAGVAGINTAEAARAAFADIVSRGWGRTEVVPNAHGRETLRITLNDPAPGNTAGGRN